jgi:hypothetical protein
VPLDAPDSRQLEIGGASRDCTHPESQRGRLTRRIVDATTRAPTIRKYVSNDVSGDEDVRRHNNFPSASA